MKKVLSIIIFLSIITLLIAPVQAAGTVSLSASSSGVTVGDEFSISVNLSGASVATLTVRVNVDTSKVDYVSGPSNSSFSGGRAIYTWTDPNGGDTPKTGGTIVTFRFRAKAAGAASFSVTGDLYSPDESPVNPSFSGVNVNISEKQTTPNPPTTPTTPTNPTTPTTPTENNTSNPQTPSIPGTSGGNTNNTALSSNANLKSMSLDVEGISPSFNKNTTQYNLIIGNDITNIDVLATPEDSNARVDVSGNTNLQSGASKINVVVTAQNGNKKTYVINVTKTDNPELANANLENLAIENQMLNPEFNKDTTEYTLVVGSNIETLNVLAVPQREKATVTVEGKDNIVFGENAITVTVVAEDGITSKVYTVAVHKKTVQEELEEASLLARVSQEAIEESQNNIWEIIGGAIFIVVIASGTAGVVGILIGKYKKEGK